MTTLRTAQANLREIQARLALETDAEMQQFYEQVASQWTIEIANVKRSRSLRRRIARAWRGWSQSLRPSWRPTLAVYTLVRAWLAGKES